MKTNNLYSFILVILLSKLLGYSAAYAQVGIKLGAGYGNKTPSAVLDLGTGSQGLLLPNVALTAKDSYSPLAGTTFASAAPAGMTIYNTATTNSGTSNDVTPGIYISNGTSWRRYDEITASNGLTMNGSNITFGGNLEESTTLNMNDKNVSFAGTSSTMLNIMHTSFAVGTQPGYIVFRRRYGNPANKIPVGAGIGKLSFYGYNGTTDIESASISVAATEEHETTTVGQETFVHNGSQIRFATTLNGTSTPSTRMIIDNNGNIGIGAGDPSSTLQVNGTFALTTTTKTAAFTATDANSIILSTADVTLPNASTCSGRVYIIRNVRTGTTAISITSIIDFGASASATFSLSPTTGSIMVVSNGTNWYRIQ